MDALPLDTYRLIPHIASLADEVREEMQEEAYRGRHRK